MNSALKPVLPQPGVPQPGGQSSPAKGNVANANHSVGHPQGAQNSLHLGTNNLVGQNLTHHVNVAPLPPHAVPSMAPVSANMAQMAQNMSHHGNLSHVTQNSITPAPNTAASPAKSASSSSPLSLVSQPLALTRTPEKKEPDSSTQSNGTLESPKSGANAPNVLKPLNQEPGNDKQDIAKTSPSTPKPPEKPSCAPSAPQKPDVTNSANQAEQVQPKTATTNELPEKLPTELTDPKPGPTADVAPTQSDRKPVTESANESQSQEKMPQKQEPPVESAKEEKPVSEVKKDEPKAENSILSTFEEKNEVSVDKTDGPKKEESLEKVQKVEEVKPEPKTVKPEIKPVQKSTLKLATVTTPIRKRRHTSPSNKASDGSSSSKKPAEGELTPDARTKRNRTQVQLYQSPTPELAMATKLSASAGRATPTKPNDDKLIVFYKNEYLAVRNTEGGFYVCQALQNVYRSTRKIKIRWLSQDKTADPSGEIYKPDFYDTTDKECVLTTLSMTRVSGGALALRAAEASRAASILQRALRAEQGSADGAPALTEEHPDGIDISLYKDESQLEKKARKRTSSKSSPRKPEPAIVTAKANVTPSKKAQTTPKRSPKSARKTIPTPQKVIVNKRTSAGSTPLNVASTSKTATAVTEKAKAKTPVKRTPVKQAREVKPDTPAPTPMRQARRATRDSKPSPIVPTPSTSTGAATRTPRKRHHK